MYAPRSSRRSGMQWIIVLQFITSEKRQMWKKTIHNKGIIQEDED